MPSEPDALTKSALEQLMHPAAERMLILEGASAARSELANSIAIQLGRPLIHLTEWIAPGSHRNAILFFDEADALFGERTGVAEANNFDPGTGIFLFGVAAASHLSPALLRRCRIINVGP